MLFPYGVDVPLDRRPLVNWLLIGSVVVAFGLQVTAPETEAVESYVLRDFGLSGLLGHMWLHGDIFHLGGNLWFLFIFGNAVCSKVRNWAFLPIYLFLGIMAAVVHLVFDGHPAIGASGAINGIVGMYLVYYPLNDINCLFGWGVYFRTISLSGFWLIGMWFVFDLWGAAAGVGQVAYLAHLGGFAAGVGIAILLQRIGFVTMEHDERSLVDIFDGRKRRKIRQATFNTNAREETDAMPKHEFIVPMRSPQDVVISLTPVAATAKPDVLRFSCSCGQRIKVPLSYAGQRGKCPGCKNSVEIPCIEE